VVDKARASLKQRFLQLEEHYNLFGFLCTFKDKNMSKKEVQKYSSDLEIALTHSKLKEMSDKTVVTCYAKDIDGFMLSEEMQALKPQLFTSKPQEIFRFLCYGDRKVTFPNYFIALRIMLTIPVTVASGERSFSILKLIKNYLRSTMLQDRLCNLAIISIEKEVGRSIDIETDFGDCDLYCSQKSCDILIIHSLMWLMMIYDTFLFEYVSILILKM